MRTHIKRYPVPAHTYHVDATNGNDAYSGAADKPVQTIAAVNALALRPGDRVLFKRGETWTDYKLNPAYSGKLGRPILYADYGAGAKPLFSPVNNGLEIQTAPRHDIAIANLNFDVSATATKYGAYLTNCTNFAAYNCDFKAGNGGHAFTMQDYPGCILIGCTFTGTTASGGIGCVTGNMANVLIAGCTSYANGSAQNTEQGFYISACNNVILRDCVAYSNGAHGIQVCNNSANVLVERCYVHDNRLDGLECYTLAAGCNVVFRNCLIRDNLQWGVRIAADCNGAAVYHCTIANNHNKGIILESTTPAGNIFKNNLVYQDKTTIGGEAYSAVCVNVADLGLLSTNTFDYNLYLYNGGNGICSVISARKTLAQWQALTGTPDLHSVSADPVFVTNYTDLHLQTTSPAKNAGVDLGITLDYDQNVRPYTGTNPDAGCYEFQGA